MNIIRSWLVSYKTRLDVKKKNREMENKNKKKHIYNGLFKVKKNEVMVQGQPGLQDKS